MLLMLLLAPALTIDIGWDVLPDCPRLAIDAQNEIEPGKETLITIAGAKRMNYTIVHQDGWIVKEGTTTGKVKFTPHKKYAGATLAFEATAATKGCPRMVANATLHVTGDQQSWSTPRLPSTLALIPWLLAGLSTFIAAVLIWRR